MSPDEHRRAPRATKHLLVHYRPVDQSSAGWSLCAIHDISELGIGFSSDDLLPTGTRLDLKVAAPNLDQPLQVRGEVKWHSAMAPGTVQRYGVAFVELDAVTQRALHDTLTPFLAREHD